MTRISRHLELLSLVLLSIQFANVSARRRKDGNPLSRNVVVQNKAGCRIDYFWIHPHTRELAASTTEGGIVQGGDTSVSSYVGHTFEVQEMPKKKTGQCVEEECRKTYFTVLDTEDQIFTVQDNFTVTYEDHKTRARAKAHQQLVSCKEKILQSPDLSGQEKMDQLTACMEQKLAASMEESADEIQFQQQIRKKMGKSWTDYACHSHENGIGTNVNITSTIAIQNSTWTFRPKKGKLSKHPLNVLFESDRSRIERYQDFVTEKECRALKEAITISPKLSDEYIPVATKSKNSDIAKLVERMEQAISKATKMTASLNRDPLLRVTTLEPPSVTADSDCSVGADGSMTCSSAPSPYANEMFRYSISDAKKDVTVASLLVLCETPKEGGEIFFPKTGTTLVAADFTYSAILLLHEIGGQREDDLFLDEYVVCPVREGRWVGFWDEMYK